MIDGIVTLKEVLLHPIAVIGPYGILKFCEVVIKGISRRHYQFLQIVFSSRKPAIVKSFILFFVLLMVLFGTAYPALAGDFALNRDRPPSFPKIASKMDLDRMGQWLEGAGVGSIADSFLYGLFHLGMGVSYPVSQNYNITASGGQAFRFGMSFE